MTYPLKPANVEDDEKDQDPTDDTFFMSMVY
jgi:hypothetical protein